MNKAQAEKILQKAVGHADVSFRPGQWEAIDLLVNGRRKSLVVQRTGWGKSGIYFISTRILRDRGFGPTLIVSPLLALMRDQLKAAERLGLRPATINSSNKEEWEQIERDLKRDVVDALLVSPERLSNESFMRDVLLPTSDRIGLLVVDEAHCISDWGHDFRPDYRRIVEILRRMPSNMPVLAVTATANDRVVADIEAQIPGIQVSRGPLLRESLTLQNISLPDQAARLAWLAQVLPAIPGTGIIYTLTRRDSEVVGDWLRQNGIDAAAYFSDVRHQDFADSAEYRVFLEEQLMANNLKALVATSALGMGYDKPDLGFVIHFQAPSSVVSYYQQVGRAGRALESAHGILLSGREDEEIHDYFRNTAFPPRSQVEEVLDQLEAADGMRTRDLEASVNLSHTQLEKVLKILVVENPAPVAKEGNKWYRTVAPFRMDRKRIDFLTHQREREWRQVQEYIRHDGCLMEFLCEALDDRLPQPCGRCVNCDPSIRLDARLDSRAIGAASLFLKQSEIVLPPKRLVHSGLFQAYEFLTGRLENRNLAAEEGRILARWGDAGWGRMVADGKHRGRFDSELVAAAADMVTSRWTPEPPPDWVTCVPSLARPRLVTDFAEELARKLGLPFRPVVRKVSDNRPQKRMENTAYRCRNLDGIFEIAADVAARPVLLIDDVVDSGWTMTVIAALLRHAGVSEVYPLALAAANAG